MAIITDEELDRRYAEIDPVPDGDEEIVSKRRAEMRAVLKAQTTLSAARILLSYGWSSPLFCARAIRGVAPRGDAARAEVEAMMPGRDRFDSVWQVHGGYNVIYANAWMASVSFDEEGEGGIVVVEYLSDDEDGQEARERKPSRAEARRILRDLFAWMRKRVRAKVTAVLPQ